MLSANSLFSQKRMCLIMREKGYDFVGDGYWKSVRDGVEASRTALDGEAEYREALQKIAGIKLA